MTNTVYDEYALALNMLNLNEDEVFQTLEIVTTLLKDEKTYQFFSFPHISSEEKKDVVKSSFKNINQKLLYFFYVLLDNERFIEMDKILLSYEKILEEKRNILVFEIEAAYDISEEKQNEIKTILRNKYHKSITLRIKINPELIGGIVLKQNGKVIDATILNRLELLKESLKEMRD